jgi:hypothetical protein
MLNDFVLIYFIQFHLDLQKAGIKVLLDRGHNPPGISIGRFIDRLEKVDHIVVVGTTVIYYNFKEKFESRAKEKGFGQSIQIAPRGNKMERYPMQLTRLVHENLSIVMAFAYSRKPLIDIIEKTFVGEWKYLERAIFELGEEKANRAITELAILLRILDDEERITDYDNKIGMNWNCGRLTLENGEIKELSVRDFSNKIIHAKTFKWDFPVNELPKLICYARDDDGRKWNKAEVDLVAIAGFCGRLMS